MKRRDFLRTSAAIGLAGAAAPVVGHAADTKIDVHPFIREHPDAVFVHYTSVGEKTDTAAMRDAGFRLSKELIVPSKTGWATGATMNIKPNWTSAGPRDGHPVVEKLGVNTDPYFVEGWVGAMKELGSRKYFIRECCCPTQWQPMGYVAMCERAGIDLRDRSSMHVKDMKKGEEVIFHKVPKGVVFSEIGYQAPMNEKGSCLINIAKLKSHGMGITTSIKNLQGITAKRFHQFCTRYDSIKKQYEPDYQQYFQKDLEKHIEELYAKHVKEGYPRWDRPGPDGGIWQETWVNRALDNLSCTPTALNVIEGVYSQDGNGFGLGPFEKLGQSGVTSRDYMSNIVIFGKDPFRVDIMAHWIAGQEPGNFGLFHIGIERGMSDVLDPHDIPLYEWKGGKASSVKIDSVPRTPLVTYYLQRDYGGQNEPRYHLCNEPFDYSAFKKGKRVGDCSPSIRHLGTDGEGRVNLSLTVPERGPVGITVLNSKGEAVGQLLDGDLDAGVHHVVWDNFSSPGLYTAYVKGMGWDAELGVPIYPS